MPSFALEAGAIDILMDETQLTLENREQFLQTSVQHDGHHTSSMTFFFFNSILLRLLSCWIYHCLIYEAIICNTQLLLPDRQCVAAVLLVTNKSDSSTIQSLYNVELFISECQ